MSLELALPFFRECHRSHVPCVLTHTLSSELPVCDLRKMHLKRLGNTAMTSVDCCQYGDAWKKSTSFGAVIFMKASCTEFNIDVEDTVIVLALTVLTSSFVKRAREKSAGRM